MPNHPGRVPFGAKNECRSSQTRPHASQVMWHIEHRQQFTAHLDDEGVACDDAAAARRHA